MLAWLYHAKKERVTLGRAEQSVSTRIFTRCIAFERLALLFVVDV